MTLLDESLSMFADRMADCIRNRKPVMVVTHMVIWQMIGQN